jgi:hypothetical protein
MCPSFVSAVFLSAIIEEMLNDAAAMTAAVHTILMMVLVVLIC